jgi:hypothetical protein
VRAVIDSGEQMTKTRHATLMLTTLLLAALTVFAVGALLQRSFIYYPRRYPTAVVQSALSRGVTVIEFQTSQGKQAAFLYRKVASDHPPRRLWLTFGGNAMVALDWLDLVREFPDRSAGFLFIDYPGYGSCEGSPNPTHILETSRGAFMPCKTERIGALIRSRSALSAGRWAPLRPCSSRTNNRLGR